MTIRIITLDDDGHIIDRSYVEETESQAPDPAASERIYIRPDWPPIGSPHFAARLRAWHAEHNCNPEAL